jgi:hypothetical protein
MSKITLDPVLRSRLNGLNEPLELCDENGQTLGHYLPADLYRRLLYQLAESQCPYTAEQLQAMRDEEGGKPLSSLWERLGQS